jgi:hypothetical protein
MTTSAELYGLADNGLSDDQLLFFSKHGWLLLENVFDERQCQHYLDIADRILTMVKEPPDPDRFETNHRRIFQPYLVDNRLLDALKTPGLLTACRQLIGYSGITYHNSMLVESRRPTESKDTRQPQDQLGWHREYHPQWGVTPHKTDSRLIHSGQVNVVMNFTPISPDHGVTAFLDGSHHVDGNYDKVKDQCSITQPTASAGSVLIFSESLIHAPTEVRTEQRRVSLFTWIGVPWMIGSGFAGKAPYLASHYVDDELRELFLDVILKE